LFPSPFLPFLPIFILSFSHLMFNHLPSHVPPFSSVLSSIPNFCHLIHLPLLPNPNLCLCSVLIPISKLTPHVLSEWMVEVCGPYLCRNAFGV
jgi:hypothetical protein